MRVYQVEVTSRVIEALEKLGIPYMLTGSMAAATYGVPRATRDADIVVQARSGDGSRLAAELGSEFYLDVETAEEAIRRRECFSAIHIGEAFKVDLFVLGTRPYDQASFDRRRREYWEAASREAFIQTREDTVLAKLRWYRLGGQVSEQQWKDVVALLKLRASSLDRVYLRHWAREEEVLDLLDRATKDAE